MPQKFPLSAVVRAQGGDRVFEAIAHVSDSKADRLIEEHFYTKYGCDFDGTHVEIELVTEVDRLPYEKYIHYYRATSGIVFLCWTEHVPSLAAAKRIFEMWCVGTTYTTIFGKEFDEHYAGDPDKLIEKMRQFDIHLSE